MAVNAESLDQDLLPARLAEIADACGVDVAYALVEHWGGLRIYVPTQVRDDHPLTETLGRDRAQRLADHCGLEHIDVPRCLQAMREQRNRVIRREGQHESQATLARRYRLTDRQIRTILHESPHDDSQQSLL